MKKKVFSKLLMVALVATVGVFSSCKDYDDDISDVRRDITQTATELRTDYTNKINVVNTTVEKLQTQYNDLEAAYKAADTQLSKLIETKYSEAVSTAQAYSDANLLKANDAIASSAAQAAAATAAAEKAAKDYADVQAAAAQAAAIAAAQKEVADAKAELQDALAKANSLIATQGEKIENLIKADADLTAAVQAAQAKANEAYNLADKANTLAEQNKANLEKAAADIATLQTNLANLQGTAASAADVAKLQSDLAALQKEVSENVVNLAEYNKNLTQTTSDLAKLKEDLAKEVSVLGENIAAVKATADANVAKIDAINDQLAKLSEANTQAHEQIIASVNTLAATVEANKAAAASATDAAKAEAAAALKNAVEALEAKLAAAKTLIETNDAAIRLLVNTEVSRLEALINGNASEIAKNAEAIEKNAKAQAAENVLMNNAIAQNATDIVKQGKDITNLQDAVEALQKALGKETAATLKAYAESVAQTAADKALLEAEGYADEKDAALKTTLLQAIKDQAEADKKAWDKAIEVAVGTLIETYKLNALAEMIKNAKDEAIADGKTYTDGQVADALEKAQKISDKALSDAKHYTDDLKTFLTTNYSTTKDMNAAIEAAKQAAVAQAFKNVMDVLFADNTDWTEDGKTTTIAKVVKKLLTEFAAEAGYTNEEAAAKIAKDAIDAALLEEIKDQPGKLDREGGVIWAAIKTAADQAAADLADVNRLLDARISDIEDFLDTTSGKETLDATIDFWIKEANLVSKDDYVEAINAINAKLDGGDSELKSQLEAKIKLAQDQADENAQALLAINAALANINAKFVNEEDAEAVQETIKTLDQKTVSAFETNISDLIDRINEIYNVTGQFEKNLMEVVNANLNSNLQSMVTSISLFSGVHEDAHGWYDDGSGYNEVGFDHHLVFAYAIEKGTTFPYESLQPYVDGKLEFTEGYVHTYADSILVRVSPVNAELDIDHIALLNSKGEDLVEKGIIKVEDVEPFKRDWYLTRMEGYDDNDEPNDPRVRATRGDLPGTGLWVIKFRLQEKNENVWSEFKSHAFANEHNGQPTETPASILYAVAVKNTNFSADENAEDDGINRYVVSEYDLDLDSKKTFHIWNYFVNDQAVNTIHNRYIVNENKPNSATAAPLWTADPVNFPKSYYQELTFAPYVDKADLTQPFSYAGSFGNEAREYCYALDMDDNEVYINYTNFVGKDASGKYFADKFGEKIIYDYPAFTYEELDPYQEGDKLGDYNVIDRYRMTDNQKGGYMTNGVDNREDYEIKTLTFKKRADGSEWADITIHFPNPTCNWRTTKVAGWFVMLDQNFARESYTSEISAWTQYIYENVGLQSMNGYDWKTGKFIVDNARDDAQAGISKGIKKAKLFTEPTGTISIKNARGAKGDIIGFRVYAVNVDGTLYDPDGRAFYVKVGDEKEVHSLAFEVETKNVQGDTATNYREDIVAYNKKAKEDETNMFFNIQQIELNEGDTYSIEYVWRDGEDEEGNKITNPVVWYDGEAQTPEADSENPVAPVDYFFSFEFTSEDPVAAANEKAAWKTFDAIATGTIENPYADIQHVKVTLDHADRLVDGETYFLKAIVKLHEADGTVSVVNEINIDVTKKMPETLPDAFRVRGATSGNAIKYNETVFLRPIQGPQNRPWYINWFDKDDKDSNYGFDDVDSKQILWASDTRPYGFEEMFAGIMPNNIVAQMDQNYKFIFEGCGNYDDDKIDGDAVSVYDNPAGQMTHYGFDSNGNYTTNKHPYYAVPYVHYTMSTKTDVISVKAAYIYRGISYNPAKQIASGSDYEIKPYYFDSFGKKADKDGAAFKVKFACAIDKGTFALNYPMKEAADGSGEKKVDQDTIKVFTGLNAYGTAMTIDKADAEYEIRYGNDFSVMSGKINGKPTLSWKSNLPAFLNQTTDGASYYRTAFRNSLYADWTNLEEGDTIRGKNNADQLFVYFAVDSVAFDDNNIARWGFGLIEEDVKEYNDLVCTIKYKVDNQEYTLDEEGLEDFYVITKNEARHCWNFQFRDNTLMPTNWQYITLNFTSKANKYGLMTQWAHRPLTGQAFAPSSKVVIRIKNPNASPEIQHARQARK